MARADEFAQTVIDQPGGKGPFAPSAYYDPHGDCVEVLMTNEPFKGARLDKWVTVYHSKKTGEVMGSLIKDVTKLLQAFPGLNIEIECDNSIRISYLLRAPMWSSGDKVKTKAYKVLIEKAEEHNIVAELQLA